MNMSNQVARRASGIQPVSKVVWPVGLGKWLFTCVQHQHLCLHYCVQLWALLYRKEVELLEHVLRGAMKVVKELRNRVYKSSRENWGCLIWRKRRLRGDLVNIYSYLKGDISEVVLVSS